MSSKMADQDFTAGEDVLDQLMKRLDAEIEKNVALHWLAIAFPMSVLPVPGGPKSSTPFVGARRPVKRCGIFIGMMEQWWHREADEGIYRGGGGGARRGDRHSTRLTSNSTVHTAVLTACNQATDQMHSFQIECHTPEAARATRPRVLLVPETRFLIFDLISSVTAVHVTCTM